MADPSHDHASAPRGLHVDGPTGLSSFGLSILLHAVALMILAFLWLPMVPPRNPLATVGDVASSNSKPVETLPQVTLQANEQRQSRKNTTRRSSSALTRRRDVELRPVTPSAPAPASSPDGSPEVTSREAALAGGTRGADFGKNAVAYGPFKVWADPPTPEINKPYSIWIRVKVPKSQQGRYAPGDLSGRILGNDSQVSGSRYRDYTQQIPWDQAVAASGHREFRRHAFYWHLAENKRFAITRRSLKRRYPVKGEYAYIEIKVPGAKVARVEDIVTVRSELWDLEHRFRLVFAKPTKIAAPGGRD